MRRPSDSLLTWLCFLVVCPFFPQGSRYSASMFWCSLFWSCTESNALCEAEKCEKAFDWFGTGLINAFHISWKSEARIVWRNFLSGWRFGRFCRIGFIRNKIFSFVKCRFQILMLTHRELTSENLYIKWCIVYWKNRIMTCLDNSMQTIPDESHFHPINRFHLFGNAIHLAGWRDSEDQRTVRGSRSVDVILITFSSYNRHAHRAHSQALKGFISGKPQQRNANDLVARTNIKQLTSVSLKKRVGNNVPPKMFINYVYRTLAFAPLSALSHSTLPKRNRNQLTQPKHALIVFSSRSGTQPEPRTTLTENAIVREISIGHATRIPVWYTL